MASAVAKAISAGLGGEAAAGPPEGANGLGRGDGAPPRLFYGWLVVAICCLGKALKCQGQNNFMAYTVPHLLEDFDLSHSELGTLFTIATVSAGLVQPHLGKAFDRFKGRACCAAAQLALATTLLSFAAWQRPASRSSLYLQTVVRFFFIRSLSLGACETFPNATVQQWFVRRRGDAMAILNMITTFMQSALSPTVFFVVSTYGWRTCFVAGACANLLLAPLTFAAVRSCPEALGLLPDGDTEPRAEPAADVAPVAPVAAVAAGPAAAAGPEARAARAAGTEGDGGWFGGLGVKILPFLGFAFFYAVIFGGCDFYMVELIEDAGGAAGGVDVAGHIFIPYSVTVAVVSPAVSMLAGRFGEKLHVLCGFLCTCCFMTAGSTAMLTVCSTPLLGIANSLIRGITGGIAAPLLTSGLAYAALGVGRERIGGILGLNQMVTLCGTGMGPTIYGTYRDMAGTFRGSLFLTSLPPFALGFFFAVAAVRSALGAGAPSQGTAKEPDAGAEEEGLPLRGALQLPGPSPAVVGAEALRTPKKAR